MKKRNFDKILKFCNSIRKKIGKKPVGKLKKGEREYGEACPITVTTGVSFSGLDYIRLGEDGPYIKTPEYVEKFMSDFDDGEYPELIKGEK